MASSWWEPRQSENCAEWQAAHSGLPTNVAATAAPPDSRRNGMSEAIVGESGAPRAPGRRAWTTGLGVLLGAFGSKDPVADINNDGIVDAADLGILLGAFGSTL